MPRQDEARGIARALIKAARTQIRKDRAFRTSEVTAIGADKDLSLEIRGETGGFPLQRVYDFAARAQDPEVGEKLLLLKTGSTWTPMGRSPYTDGDLSTSDYGT